MSPTKQSRTKPLFAEASVAFNHGHVADVNRRTLGGVGTHVRRRRRTRPTHDRDVRALFLVGFCPSLKERRTVEEPVMLMEPAGPQPPPLPAGFSSSCTVKQKKIDDDIAAAR